MSEAKAPDPDNFDPLNPPPPEEDATLDQTGEDGPKERGSFWENTKAFFAGGFLDVMHPRERQETHAEEYYRKKREKCESIWAESDTSAEETDVADAEQEDAGPPGPDVPKDISDAMERHEANKKRIQREMEQRRADREGAASDDRPITNGLPKADKEATADEPAAEAAAAADEPVEEAAGTRGPDIPADAAGSPAFATGGTGVPAAGEMKDETNEQVLEAMRELVQEMQMNRNLLLSIVTEGIHIRV
jgi:hypothetical protein